MRSLNRALVVGGAGFLGSWLVDALAEQRFDITIVDERPVQLDVEPPMTTELIEADAADIELASILDARNIDVVFQLAGTGSVPQTFLRPRDDLQRNTATTICVLEAARHARRAPIVAFVSSAAVYGEGERMPMHEEHPLKPISPYGISKLAAEHYVSLYSRIYDIPAFSVRPFSLYGPRQRKLVVYDLMTRIFDGESPLTLLGSADVSRDFVFVSDCARALVALAHAAPANGEPYNIASGRPTTLGELASTLLELSGLSTIARFTGDVRPGDPLHWDGDPARARALGARCDTPLREGLERTIEWFVKAREAGSLV
jgi:UDP-glucose 4-epimerase